MTTKSLICIALTALTFACSPTSASAQTVSGCGTATIPKADANSIPKLGKGRDCFALAEAFAAAAREARSARILAITPASVPTPAPAPTPVADPLDGVPAVPSGINVAANLIRSWGTGDLPGPEAPGIEGAFRFLCAPSHNAYDDPIVYPGQPGRSHLHTFFGNTKADANSTYASLRTTGESTCNNLLNRSAYWIPALMHPTGKVVMPDYVSIYYKAPPLGSIYCKPPYAQACRTLPRGLRMIFGYNMLNPANNDPIDARWFNCDGPGAISGKFPTIAIAATGCPVGARLGAVIVGPNCWSGELDSADHRSHMAYQRQDGLGHNVCPSTHPYLVPFFELGAWYSVDTAIAGWKFSSDIAMKTAGGVTLHGDWFGAWEDSIQALWWGNCINKALSCTGADLGNGTQLTPAAGYRYGNQSVLVDPPAMPAMAH